MCAKARQMFGTRSTPSDSFAKARISPSVPAASGADDSSSSATEAPVAGSSGMSGASWNAAALAVRLAMCSAVAAISATARSLPVSRRTAAEWTVSQ